uniref:Zinc finger, ZZ-type with EF hand domain 1 n=1 Tax=Kryptolebias marmoratus TaxID=37003 RepID=A0A3Q3B408_KRYMA
MGNSESGCGGGSGDEEDIETESPGFAEDNPASAATGGGVGGGGGTGGSDRSGRGSNNLPAPASGPPGPGVLLELVKLREAAARISDSGAAIHKSVLSGNEGVLMRWLEERLNRGEETVNVEQFCETLESRDAPRDECEEAFGQFDAEGDGVVDTESMLIALKNSNGAVLQGELSHVIRQLQACSLTPGFVDIFSRSKDRLGAHASKILKFLHRNRIPSSAIPFPILEGYNSICTMRSSVVQDFLEVILQKEKDLDIQYRAELDRDPDVDKVKVVTQCYSSIEASSNVADVYKMTNGETSSFWQLKMKPNVVLRRLAIAVASNDHSYMPQLVSVSVGKNRCSLQEIRDIRIPSNVTGYVALLENTNISHPYVQINIRQCLSDGCDTRIHGLKTLGYQITKSKEVSVSDASAIWYLSLLTSLVTASMETNPALAQTVLQSTQKALQHMPPLSLTPSSTEFPKFFSLNILEEVDGFLLRIADCCVSPDAEMTLLAFALARGSVSKILQALSCISEHFQTKYKASSLIVSMAAVRLRLLYRNGKPIQLHMLACDVKSKDEKSGPENMLTESSTGDGFLTESGRRKATVILSTEDQSNFQVIQMKIKVRKGAIGARCGLVFAYVEDDPFDAEKHFRRFKKYDAWTYKDYKEFVKDSVRSSPQTEDEPIGWFELEEDLNYVEIKLQQCRIAKFLMVKFLCTRKDSAERLGVQTLSFSGYLCPGTERLGDLDDLSGQAESSDRDGVSGLCLLNKTLIFIQQLTRDMDASQLKQKYLLDFSGLSLNLFWSFYSKLREIEGEEAMKSRVLLLQLMQNCFPMLPNPLEPQDSKESGGPDKGASAAASPSASSSEEPSCPSLGAVFELYTHLCKIVDGPEGETLMEKALHKEAVKAILSGAAVFFPDKLNRRDRLFNMMKNITDEDQPESVKVTFESLCNYFSNQDPSGLLLLPPKGAPSNFDISPILSVMETLLLVAARECDVMMMDESSGASRNVLLSLFWALQGSLLFWCYLQLKGGTATPAALELARDILLKYVDQFLGNIKAVLCSLLERYTSAEITDKLGSSILVTVFRQLMIYLLELCSLDIPHSVLLKSFSSLVELIKNLSNDTRDIFSKVDQESWQQPQKSVVLRTWNMESPHNYENSRHETTVFACPGATLFEVEFDERCETEKRYDYLEFTDSRGGKVRYDMKVGTEKWPKKVTFDAGPQLQFLFHSDNINSEWGYKFTVTALGLPDITISWISDLQLLMARLMGRLASRTLALKSPYEIRTVKELPPGKVSHVQASPLWKPILRHGLYENRETNQTNTWTLDELLVFLEDFARWNPSQELTDSRTELMRTLMQSCRKQPMRNELASGPKTDQAVNAIWAVMVYHTPSLNQALKTYVNQDCSSCLSEEFVQVYSLADSIRTWMLEMKQRYLVGKMNVHDDNEGSHEEVTMDTLAEMCIEKSLLLFRFAPCGKPSQGSDSFKASESCFAPLLRSGSISEADFQASSCPSPQTAGPDESGDARLGQSQPPSTQVTHSSSSEYNRQESLSSQPAEPASPSTFVCKAPFSRTRLRLLSFRSIEEPSMTSFVKDRYPIIKHILNFMKDQALSTASILHTLALSKAQALSVCKVLEMIQQCLHSLGQPHLFQPPCILFLQELLACQKDFTSYFSQLSDSGHKLGEEVRRSYHQLVLMLMEAVQGFNNLNEKALLLALSCVQTCLLHLLDMNWEVQDLPLFLNIKLPDLLLSMSQENISVHDIAISQWTEEDEIADYKKNQEWMDECMDGMFEKWYDKIDEEESMEDRRKMHMFIARYCDLLNVVISCDGCERMAPWQRYRCLQCMDMDLCKTCFLSGAKPEGHEDDHEMVNMEYACDHCQGLIVGSRINCNVCEDFDLCYGCYNAKKYPDSHLPTHRITVYPMVTIRISDRHRLIQPYIHNYSWLLFAALALYTSELISKRQTEGECLDSKSLEQVSALQTRCSQLITDCLLKGQTGKGLRSSTLLALLSSNDSASESELCPVSPESSQELSPTTDTSSLPGSTAAICSPSSPRDKVRTNLVTQDTLDSVSLSQTPSVSSEDPLSPVVRTSESGPGALNSPASDVAKEMDERLPQVPRQEHVFSECSRERILGLLAAMLPPAKPGSTLSLPSLSSILPQLYRAVISNAGSLNETYHLILGLLGQLLLRITPAEADAAFTEALADKYDLLTQGEAVCSDTPGWKTTQLLFSLGAVCLDSRIGLDWACTVADILDSLNACPEWSTVIAAFTDHCIQQLPQTLKRTNLFTLLVLVGFPEVLCVGTQTVFIDNANEQHNMILLKHFTEKNHAAVVDVKTRKRKTVKDYQLIQSQDSTTASLPAQTVSQGCQKTFLSRYLSNFTSIISHLLQTSQDNGSADAVEASWVLSLALKGLYNTLKKHGVEQAQEAIQQSGLMQLLVRKCSKGTGFSKLWLLRDLEILSIMLYSSKREIHSMAQDPERDQREQDKEHDSDHSSCGADDTEINKPDPLEGLDEETKICFQITHDALNAPLPILRAMYELQMKRTDSFFLEVQKRFDGEEIKTDETIRTLAQKWQPSRRLRCDERNSKAVDTDMIVVSCMSKPSHCEKATEEFNVVAQKLITNSESDLQLSYARQRRSKSSALLHKDLDVRSNRAVRQYLVKVNQAIATLYSRHVLALLLANWPAGSLLSEEALELNGASHMAYILDMLMQLEERTLWEKILQRVLKGCNQSMLSSLSLTACQFMEEPGMAVQVRESKHPYDNNTNFEDKVHIPGAIYLSVKFDSRCYTEEGCDELIMSSSSDFLQDVHNFSGSPQRWSDFEIPGDTLYYKFMSDMSNTEWGYKFTVTGGHRGRFQTGFEILKQMLADENVLSNLPLADIWEWQVGVACRQTGNQRLKAIHLLFRLLQCQSQTACDLTLLRPLWQLFMSMENNLNQDPTSITVLLPLHRALTELFFIAEARAIKQGILQEYLLAMTTDEHLLSCTAMALKNIAAISLAINYPNKSTKLLNMS